MAFKNRNFNDSSNFQFLDPCFSATYLKPWQSACVQFCRFLAGFQEKVGGPFNDRREAFRPPLKTSKKWRLEKTQRPMIMLFLTG